MEIEVIVEDRRLLFAIVIVLAFLLALLGQMKVVSAGLDQPLTAVTLQATADGRAVVQIVTADGRKWDVAVISARGTAIRYQRIAEERPRMLSLNPPVLSLPGGPDDAVVFLEKPRAVAVVASGGYLRAFPVADARVHYTPNDRQRVVATPQGTGWLIEASLRPEHNNKLYWSFQP